MSGKPGLFSWMERFMIAERAIPFLLAWCVWIWPDDLLPFGIGYLLMASASRPFNWDANPTQR